VEFEIDFDLAVVEAENSLTELGGEVMVDVPRDEMSRVVVIVEHSFETKISCDRQEGQQGKEGSPAAAEASLA